MTPIEALEQGPLLRFADWPEESLRLSAPGVYTIWHESKFLYVGISWQDRPNSKGLFGRLNAHASGRRSGDQFCIYICDLFIVPTLDPTNFKQSADASSVSTRSLRHTSATT